MSNNKTGTLTGFETAIIGMSGRFPGAENIREFWDNLINARETVSFFSDQELLEAGVDREYLENPDYVKAYGIIADIEYFDSGFFGYTPADARQMDPQMRLFHEYAWGALEDAGYDPGSYSGLIGLYVGASDNYYWQQRSCSSAHGDGSEIFSRATLNNKDFISTRTSFKLNLRGPSSTIFNACSTSLIAIHLACQSLLSGDCDMAMAGGASLSLPQKSVYLYQEGMIYSPDGHTRSFDAEARGSVFGNGIGVVVIKRLKEAIADGDHIYAVIKGTAINNDGNRKIGYTAPSVQGQAEVIRTAVQLAEVEPESISYIEAHGTATALGDPIEIEALKQAFNTDKKRFCAIGTVKSNLGHLDAAAGVTALIKTALALKHKLIPASLHFKSPNPEIDFENSPFYVNTELKEWKNHKYPLRAGVSAFGIGGTNGYVILEEAPGTGDGAHSQGRGGVSPPDQLRDFQLILLSAKTETALEKMTENLAVYFKKHLLNPANHENPTNPGLTLADAAYTLQVGRKAFNHRKMLICSTVNEAIEKLSATDTGKVHTFCPGPEDKRIVFMFSGLGAQYVNMGRELYETEPLFRQDMDRCFEIITGLVDYDIKEILYPHSDCRGGSLCPPKDCIGSLGQGDHRGSPLQSDRINQTEIASLVIFIFEFALAQLLMKWGIKPQALMGYSFGEYSAACISGVLSLEDALKLVVARGQLIKKTPQGAMLSVPLAKQDLIPLLPGELSFAIDNGPSCIVAGTPSAIAAFENRLKQEKIVSMRIRTSTAVHSALMEPVLEAFREKAGEVVLNEPRIPFISSVTGKWITAGEATDPGYWARHLRETVQFDDGFKRLLAHLPRGIFLEIGPGHDLVMLVQRHFKEGSGRQAVNLIPPARKKVPGMQYLLSKIGTLWLYGQAIDWTLFYRGEQRRRVSLPTYCFDQQRYWLDEDASPGEEASALPSQLLKKPAVGDWFYLPQWHRCLRPSRPPLEAAGWLVFTDDCGIGDGLVNTWLKENPHVIIVRKGSAFEKVKPKEYVMDPANADDYYALLEDVKTLDLEPGLFQVIHMWSIEPASDQEHGDTTRWETVKKNLDMGYYSLVYLVHALEKQDLNIPLCFTVVSNNMQEVVKEKDLFPGKMTLVGPVMVIPREYPNIRTRSIDIVIPPGGSIEEDNLLRQLKDEISSEIFDTLVALRSGHRWVQDFEPVDLPAPSPQLPLKERGVYLITGGFGDVGYLLAKHLACKVNARLVLVGRTPLPKVERWQEWLTTHGDQDPVTQKIDKVRELEEEGAKVLAMSADVSNLEQMQAVIEQTEKVLGPINGVIHSAGTVDPLAFHPLREIDEEKCNVHFNPKIYGTLVLEKVLAGKKLDFCLLMSSIAAILGGVGFTAYSAANLFLDAFLQQQAEKSPIPWICINWDHWEPGQDVDPAKISRVRQLQLSMTPQEGIDAFERILCIPRARHLVHSLSDLHEKIRLTAQSQVSPEKEEPKKETVELGTLTPRPNLSSPHKPPHSQTQQALVQIWQTFFGIRGIGIEDDFFELGGDSLKAISVTSRIHKELHVNIPVWDFFDHPTIKELAGYIDGAGTSTYIPIEPVEKKEYYELSSAQMRLYILDQLEPGSIHYNNPMVMTLAGEFRQDKLTAVFIRLIDRHQSFRTSFEVIKEKPLQKIHDGVPFSIEYFETGEEQAKAIIQRFTRPFDLGRAPLIRVGLIKVEERIHVLIIDVHHIIADGTSLRIIIRELTALYEGEELIPLKVRYKDFSGWQNKKEETLKKQEEYWLQEFQGEIPVLDLPLDYARPAVQAFEGDIIGFTATEQEIKGLERLAAEQGATLFMTMLSIFNIFLCKMSGQEDIVVGTPTAGRQHPDLAHIIGMFVNTLALRNYPTGQKTFKAFLKEVKERTLKAFDNQDYQFEDLVEGLSVNRDTARNPLFDVMFALHNLDLPRENIPDKPAVKRQLGLGPYNFQHKVSRFDMTFHGDKVGGELIFKVEYSTKLFKKETIHRFTRYFKKALSSILQDPVIRLSRIEILDVREKEAILEMSQGVREANGPTNPDTLHHLFEAQVERTPDRVALIGPDPGVHRFTRSVDAGPELLTYRQLNRRSNQLARVLREKGVKPGHIVALLVERSVEMVTGILAILKAGGAHLAIGTEFPGKRKEYILADSDAKLLLTNKPMEMETVSGFTANAVEVIDISEESLYKGDSGNLEKITDGTSLLYIIYTSGSTGQPKGVMLEHRNMVNLLEYQNKYTNLECSRILQFATISFDASIHEIFSALLFGGRLYLIQKEIRGDIPGLLVFVEKNSISTLFLPVSFLRLIFSEADYIKRVPRVIKHIQTAGEQVIIGEKFRDYLKKNHIFLHNHYGPSETHVVTTFTVVPTGNIPELPPIGRPILNTDIYILDKGVGLAPAGVVGELYVAGLQVGRGYLNNPQLTAEKFVEQVTGAGDRCRCINKKFLQGSRGQFFQKAPPGRRRQKIYKTGDLARWLANGEIEFLGRIDHQVKIRGYRIEMGEIEKQLTNLEMIEEAVVIAREEEKGNQYLCAYIVPSAGGAAAEISPVSWDLRKCLSGILPHYMIPSYFVTMEQIPLTPIGKVDRRALPRPEISASPGYTPPVTVTEKQLLELWSGVLGIKKELIGIDTSFFQLGGHSLKATILTTKIHKKFNVRLPLTEIFKTSTISGLAKYIQGASREKYAAIRPVEKKDYYPLSSPQKRLYILNRMNPDKPVYNLPEIIPLAGEFDRAELEETFKKLITRHESLRTSFHMIKEEAVQAIHDTVEFELDFFHIQDYRDFIKRFVRPFDLTRPPLLRVNLLHLENPAANILMVDIHHIVSDGVSHEVLVKDFLELHDGKELPLLRIQYKDYALWQNNEKKESSPRETYWLNEMAGEIPVLNLPLDYPRPAVWDFEGSTLDFYLPAGQTRSLNALALNSGTTLYMVLLAIYNLLLSKLSGQQDIIVGTPVAGRPHADLEKIIGMFVNTLAIRSYPPGQQVFEKFLQEVKSTTLQAFENQEYPFEELVDQVVVNRDTSRNPIFDVAFTMQNMQDMGQPVDETSVPDNRRLDAGPDVRSYYIEQRTAKFDLNLICVEVEGKLAFCFEYGTKLFKKETIEKFVIYFKRLAAMVLENSSRKISQIEIITPEEKQKVLYDFNDTAASYPHHKTLHRLITEQVQRTPDHTALIGQIPNSKSQIPNKEDAFSEDISITYRELNEQAGQLAYILKEKGVEPDTIVGIMVEPSTTMIIGLLGILKAGGAYLPIDPDYPEERIDFMLKDSNTRVLLTTPKLQVKVKAEVEESVGQPPQLPLEFIDIETRLSSASEHPPSTLTLTSTCQVSPANLAYIIYTSGTTGRPKGVPISHRQVVRLMVNNKFQFDFNRGDVWTLFHSYCFDFSVWEMYGALLYGGKLVIISRKAARDTGTFLEILKNQAVTVLNQTPAAFYALMALELNEASADLRLRCVIFGGEALEPARLKGWRSRYPRTKTINMYGITETTVHVTFKEIRAKEVESGVSNIGTPIPTLAVYVVDHHLNPQPIGIPGELSVGGDGVARGYLNRPELTFEKFVYRSYGSYKSYILYLTGDRGRWLPAGDLEYLGRQDRQVKVRGYRIELGEIENRLLLYDGIEEAVVISRRDTGGDNHLCAYIVGNAFKKGADTGPLQEHLLGILPGYMVPANIVSLEKIPLTANGKVDRRQLPEPGTDDVSPGRVYAPPTDEHQEKLLEIWWEVLNPGSREKPLIGMDDNFFQRGGHSLRAAVMTTLIRKTFKVDISLIDVFTNPTIRGLAEIISRGRTRNRPGEPKPISIKPTEEKEYYALSSAQKRLWIIQQLEKENVTYNVTFSVELQGEVKPERLKEIFNRLTEHHEGLRTSFVTVRQQPVQKIHARTDPDIGCDDETTLKSLSPVKPGKITTPTVKDMIKDFVRAFDLSRAPLFRVRLIKTGTNNYLLMLDMHHIITDGTSVAVLQKDFTALYNGGSLPPLELRYRDFSEWQNREKSGQWLRSQESFWLEAFSGQIPQLNLPFDFPRPRVQAFKGKTFNLQIIGEEKHALNRLALEEEATLFMVLAAIFAVLLFRINRGDETGIVMGVPIAGRHADPGLRQVMGMFVNTLALLTEPTEEKTFQQFQQEVKERTLAAFANQDYQFDNLVDRLGLPREANRNPLFQVMIALQNIDQPAIKIPGLTLKPLPIDSNVAYFDLALEIREFPDLLLVSFNYDTQLFKPSTIEGFANYFQETVSAVTRDRTMRLKDIYISHRLISPDPGLFEKEISLEDDEAFAF